MAAEPVEALEGEHEATNNIEIEAAQGDDVDRGVVNVIRQVQAFSSLCPSRFVVNTFLAYISFSRERRNYSELLSYAKTG